MPDLTPEEIANDERAAWDEAWSGSLYEDAIAFITARSGQAEIAIELGGITPASRVLDVGCGPGILSESLAQMADSVEGIDFLETMIEQAKSRRSGASFQVADAEQLPVAAGDFDVAVCCYSSHHFVRPEKVYGELYRVLKPGGRVVVLHPIQAETATFGAIYQTLEEVLPAETVASFPSLAGPLFEVETPEPYLEMLSLCGFTDIVAEKRTKPCTLKNVEALISITARIGRVDAQSEEMRSALAEATAASSAQYRQDDGSYLFPDNIIVAKGVKP
ncbi:MAG: methyltransferase domain-containing protein [Xanthomonadales bacterium]|nr:methyltransferase domain-containing protein [Xanthomonadales bacterium]